MFAVVSYGHEQAKKTLSLPDNIPIVIVLAALGFLYWLSLRQAVRNDRLIAAGEPPREAAEKNRKVLVWPDLVYTELIAMVVCTVILVVWSIVLKAPLEEPANAARTPTVLSVSHFSEGSSLARALKTSRSIARSDMLMILRSALRLNGLVSFTSISRYGVFPGPPENVRKRRWKT